VKKTEKCEKRRGIASPTFSKRKFLSEQAGQSGSGFFFSLLLFFLRLGFCFVLSTSVVGSGGRGS
jgi:hypothetical protein